MSEVESVIFPFQMLVFVDVEVLAEAVVKSVPYEQMLEFMVKLDELIADVSFTEELIAKLHESLAGEYD